MATSGVPDFYLLTHVSFWKHYLTCKKCGLCCDAVPACWGSGRQEGWGQAYVACRILSRSIHYRTKRMGQFSMGFCATVFCLKQIRKGLYVLLAINKDQKKGIINAIGYKKQNNIRYKGGCLVCRPCVTVSP